MEERLNSDTEREFCATVARKYRYYCARTGEKETPEGLVMYAIRCNIIRERTVSHYMMMELYPREMYNAAGRLEAINALSEKTGLAERTIRALLTRPCRYTPTSK